MKTRLAVITALLCGVLSAQLEMNYSYEMKYGNGLEDKSGEKYNYLENLLDINTYYGDNIYVYTQLEYSDPPIFGYRRTGLDSMLSAFYIEYSHERFNVKLGDLYEMYGRGLAFYTLQDQNIDYNNSVTGMRLNYYFDNNILFSGLLGTKEHQFKFFPTSRVSEPYSHMLNNIALFSINVENEIIGTTQYLYKHQYSVIEYDLIDKIFISPTDLGQELLNRAFTYFESGIADTIYTYEHNLSVYHALGPFDIYMDKVWNRYTKIYGNEVFGSRFYTSVYTELFGTGITYEYKNYYTPYLIKSISNPPIVYRESNSILASRNVHSMNFGNEIGHQIDLNRNLFGNMNVAANLSLSHRNQMGDMESISLLDILSMKDEDKMDDYYPFRQVYLEINGWALADRLYYKLGIDHFTEFYAGKNTSAFTIPTHWVWKLSSESSLTIYLETQKKNVQASLNKDEYTDHYFSSSYSHMGNWVLTGFYDQEIKDSKSNEWIGADFSYKLNTETQISLFYGSQKGGLVCANGICTEQPGFKDGYKITFRSLF